MEEAPTPVSESTPEAPMAAEPSKTILESAPPITDFRSEIQQEYMSSQTVANAQSVNDLAKQVVNLEKVMGKPKVELPQENWNEQNWNEFYNKTGRPETIEGYQAPSVDGFQFSENDQKTLFESFHKSGISQKQASDIMQTLAQRELNMADQINQKFETNEAAAKEELAKRWGDNFEMNQRLAATALRETADADAFDRLNEKFGNDPDFLDIMSKMGNKMMDDTEFKSNLQSNTMTSDIVARSEIDQLKLDGNFQGALLDAGHPGHKAALERWSKLHQAAY